MRTNRNFDSSEELKEFLSEVLQHIPKEKYFHQLARMTNNLNLVIEASGMYIYYVEITLLLLYKYYGYFLITFLTSQVYIWVNPFLCV